MYELYNTDAVSFMKSLKDKSIDTLFADPPYGIGVEYDGYEDTRENLAKLVNAFMPEALRVAKRVAITPGTRNIWLYPESTWIMGFANQAGSGLSPWGFTCWQPILVYGKDPYLANKLGARPDTMFMKNSTDIDKGNGHPCPKPNNVMRWIIERTTMPGETVLDPFMGSGTTGEACVALGRDFIGIEQSLKYFEIAQKRMENAPAPLFTMEA